MVQSWFGKTAKSLTMVVISAAVCSSSTALANNVSVRVEANTLIVRGDAAANEVVISQNANGNVVVTGRRGTRVNGNASFTSNRRFTHVEMFMGSGDDTVRVQSLNILGNLEINMGPGVNRLFGNATRSVVGGNLSVYGGNQRDEVNIDAWSVAGSMDIDLFNGPSVVVIRSTGVGGFLDVYGGDQADSVTLVDLLVGLDIDVETYAGQDVVTVSGSDARTLDLITGGGNDTVDLSELTLTLDLDIITGGGDDSVAVEGVTAARDVDVLLGAGNDLLAVTSLTAFRDLTLDGQAGAQDTLIDGGFGGNRESEVLGFEIRN